MNYYTFGLKAPAYHSMLRHQIVQHEVLRKTGEDIPRIDNWLADYLQAAGSDYKETVEKLWRLTRPNERIDAPLDISVSDLMTSDAFVLLNADESASINITHGFMHALDDLFVRLACNKSFFSRETDSDLPPAWDGCQCLWFKKGMVEPHTRFYDYRQVVPRLAENLEDPAVWCSAFYCGIPLDGVRYNMATDMFAMALSWLIMHEDSHFFEGHCYYRAGNPEFARLGADAKRVGEVATNKVEEPLRKLQRVFEWEADRGASRGVVDVFGKKEALPLLPEYCGGDPRWLLRMLLVSAGCVPLIFHKAHLLYKDSADNYPSPKARVVGVIQGMLAQWQQRVGHGSLSFGDMDLALTCAAALRDLWLASELLPFEDDHVDKGVGFHYRDPTPNMDLFESHDELMECTFAICGLREGPSYHQEVTQLIEEHDSNVYDRLEPFRRMAGNPL
jgi:hypothetical protein